MRFGTGAQGPLRRLPSLDPVFRSNAAASPAGKACLGLQKLAVALANTFWRLGREVVARARALATVLTFLSICSRRFGPAPGHRSRSRWRQGAPWGRLARHQATLSTSAHADHERDQGRVTPCYPDERCFLAWFGKSLWSFKNAFFGHVLNQPKLPKHVGVGSPAEKRGGSLLHLA